MKISKLIECNYNIDIKGITDDSRSVKKDYLFVATKGYNVDHYDYINDAIKNGCAFVISEKEVMQDIPSMVVSDAHLFYIEACQKFYDVRPSDFHFIGVTGTDGKTTTTTIIKEIIGNAAYLGTNGLSVGNNNYDTNNTTPCINEFYHDLSIIKKNNCNTVSMEVSSEALLHKRIDTIFYDIIGFTNITGDHISIHGSFENYKNCKLSLIKYLKENGKIFINGDDEILKGIKYHNSVKFGFSKDNDIVIEKVEYNKNETIISLSDSTIIHSPLFGKYNVYNVVMGYLIGLSFGCDKCLLLNRIKRLSPIKGRCEFLNFGQKYDIVLDYAHTINGVKSIIDAFNNYSFKIVVCGCAGGRDSDKRSIIGDYIINNSDICIFTMDDPRYENVDDIIDQMVGKSKDYFRIIDREDAIKYALNIAPINSVVLILGKGRDNYMAIKDKKIHYSDYDVIYNYFNKE